MALENRIRDELVQVYKVPEDLCEAYNQCYSENILRESARSRNPGRGIGDN